MSIQFLLGLLLNLMILAVATKKLGLLKGTLIFGGVFAALYALLKFAGVSGPDGIIALTVCMWAVMTVIMFIGRRHK
jgi:hypothetical protein